MRDRLTKHHVYRIPEASAEVGHQARRRSDPDLIVERSRWPDCRFAGHGHNGYEITIESHKPQ